MITITIFQKRNLGVQFHQYHDIVTELAKEHIGNLKYFDFSKDENGNTGKGVNDDWDNRPRGIHETRRKVVTTWSQM
jgi:hypothetical protein